MSNELRLRSRLIRAVDPKGIDVSEFQIPLTVDEALYERDLLNFRRRFSVQVKGTQVEPQDMVTISCTSELPRFCKEHITIRIGMGLFSKELENQLIGWTVGQSGTVTVRQQNVTVTVEDICRESLPEVDDKLAKRCKIDGIETAADIYAYCKGMQFDDQLEDAQDEAFAYLSRQVLSQSEFELDAEELELCQQMQIRALKANPAFRETSWDDMPEDKFREIFFSSKEELLESMKASGVYSLQAAVLGQYMLENAGKLLTAEDYEDWLSFRPGAASKDMELLRQEYPAVNYIMDEYGDHCMCALEELALRKLKECLK